MKLSTGCIGSGDSREVQAKVSHCLCSAWGHQHELHNYLQMAITCVGLGATQVNQGQLLLVLGLGPLSERHRAPG